nr:right-handed parallel beta-helix repeat-containing protein [Mucilaginibacter sp. L294]
MKKLFACNLCLALVLFALHCKSQIQKDLPVPQNYFVASKYTYTSVAGQYPSAYDITSALPAGYVKDGSIDYTTALQSALNNHKIVLFPDFPVLINQTGLTVNSNSTLIFKPSSKLILKTNNLGIYEILRIHNVENVNVFFPVIVGDKQTHTGTEGQWGMGISIKSSKTIRIVDANISQCWGDGIYLAQIKYVPNENITIENPFLNMNRRNGISVTNVNGLKVLNAVIANTSGQNPQCGIDIEPNTNKDVINNISILNPITFNNFKYGIIISLNKLAGVNKKEVNINIDNHVDDSSQGGFAINAVKNTSNPFTGNVNITNSVWKNSRRDPLYYSKQNFGYKLNISNFDVQTKNKNGMISKDILKLNRVRAKLSGN